jgi:hypothetical protein
VSRREQANAPAKPQPPATHAPASAVVKAADAKPAAKPAIKKKVAEKQKKPPPQQAALQWPWSLFSN